VRGNVSQIVRGNVSQIVRANVSQIARANVSQIARGNVSQIARGNVSQIARANVSQIARANMSQIARGDVLHQERRWRCAGPRVTNLSMDLGRRQATDRYPAVVSTLDFWVLLYREANSISIGTCRCTGLGTDG
jgi:hypothetical protein